MQLTLQITTGPHAGRKVLLRSGQVARLAEPNGPTSAFRGCGAGRRAFRRAMSDQRLGCAKWRSIARCRSTIRKSARRTCSREIRFRRDNRLLSSPLTGTPATMRDAGRQRHFDGWRCGGRRGCAIAAMRAKEQRADGDGNCRAIADGRRACGDRQDRENRARIRGGMAAEVMGQGGPRAGHLLPEARGDLVGNFVGERGLRREPAAGRSGRQRSRLAWVEEPGETRRRRCEAAAGKTKFDGPGSWLAMAAFWSGGSIAPDDMGDVPPG